MGRERGHDLLLGVSAPLVGTHSNISHVNIGEEEEEKLPPSRYVCWLTKYPAPMARPWISFLLGVTSASSSFFFLVVFVRPMAAAAEKCIIQKNSRCICIMHPPGKQNKRKINGARRRRFFSVCFSSSFISNFNNRSSSYTHQRGSICNFQFDYLKKKKKMLLVVVVEWQRRQSSSRILLVRCDWHFEKTRATGTPPSRHRESRNVPAGGDAPLHIIFKENCIYIKTWPADEAAGALFPTAA